MSQNELTDIEKEKVDFLKDRFIEEQLNSQNQKSISVYLLGVWIHIDFSDLKEKDYEELIQYYQYFQKPNDAHISYEVHVSYACFTDERQSLNHPWYCERYPRIHFLDEALNNKKVQLILERDYAAYTTDQLKSVVAFGPRPNKDNPDSLDNLIAMVFASCNQHHPALLLHSATIIKDDKAWVFFGQSGAGKSTLAFHAYQNFKNKVISSDQTLLKVDNEKVVAQSTPITIPELPRDTPMREWQPVEVAGLIHLVQKNASSFVELSSQSLLKKFLEQSLMYLTPYSDQQSFLNLSQEILTKENLIYGELSYEKGSDFWKLIP